MFKLLVNEDCDVDHEDEGGYTITHLTSWSGLYNCLRKICEQYNHLIHFKDNYYFTCLCDAVFDNQLTSVQLLILHVVDVYNIYWE